MTRELEREKEREREKTCTDFASANYTVWTYATIYHVHDEKQGGQKT